MAEYRIIETMDYAGDIVWMVQEKNFWGSWKDIRWDWRDLSNGITYERAKSRLDTYVRIAAEKNAVRVKRANFVPRIFYPPAPDHVD